MSEQFGEFPTQHDGVVVDAAKTRIEEAGDSWKAKTCRDGSPLFDEVSYERLLNLGREWRDKDFALLIAGMLAIAAETHPEIIRTALGKVFDTAGIEDTTNRIMLLIAQANGDASEALRITRDGVHENKRSLEALRSEIDVARHDFNKFRQWINEKFTAARKFFVELRDLAKQSRQPLFGKDKKK